MIELQDVAVVRQGRTILEIDALALPTDQMTVILGHNGSGKSTLASVLAGLTKPDRGRVLVNGQDLFKLSDKARARLLAYLPQKLPLSQGLTCQELVALGRYPWRGLLGRMQTSDYETIQKAMKATHTWPFKDSLVDALSGGERQRVWIAMLLAQASELLLLDEPTSALDVKHQYAVMRLLRQLHDENHQGIFTIIHDVNLALRYSTYCVALKKGRVLFHGPTSILEDESHLAQLYDTPIELLNIHADREKPRWVAVVKEDT